MSVLKGILHHWNKTNKNYDTIHPETESAQITDWHSGIMSSLASKTLGTVVDAITTDSVLGKLIKMLLDASGVRYLIDTNGYVCFGSLFGGLIIQWGIVSGVETNSFIALPLSANPKAVVINDTNKDHYPLILTTYNYQNGGFFIDGARRDGSITALYGYWIAICH